MVNRTLAPVASTARYVQPETSDDVTLLRPEEELDSTVALKPSTVADHEICSGAFDP